MSQELAKALVEACRELGLKIATAESCTGGLLAGAITDIPGASEVLERGFVTYSNRAKQEMLGVREESLRQYGAVSRQVAEEMVMGALAHSVADLAIAVTGIAGPGGGTATKPVGLVYLACVRRGQAPALVEKRYGDVGRAEVRGSTVGDALLLLQQSVQNT